MKFSFSLKDYQSFLQKGKLIPPNAFQPYIPIDRLRYWKLETLHKEKEHDYRYAFGNLHKRVGNDYFREVYPAQSRSLDYSQSAFPAYKFILPEVLADDWLAIVDWRKFQRDHALHQPLTAYIVLKLLGNGASGEAFQINGESILDKAVNTVLEWKGTSYLKKYLLECNLLEYGDADVWLGSNSISSRLWKALFLETAYLAALFHDFGYPWQYINFMADKLEYTDGQQEAPSQNADHIIKLFEKRLFFCPLNGYRLFDINAPANWHDDLRNLVSKAFRETHGLHGALGFLYFNDVLRDYPAREKHIIHQFCVEWAAMAIMMHDMSKIYWGHGKTNSPPEHKQLRLDFRIDPLSCIISLADVLEDFERPVVDFTNFNKSSKASYEAACKETNLYWKTSNILEIEYIMNSDDYAISKDAFLKEEQKEYFDSQFGYIDVSSLGINDVQMRTSV